MFDKIKGRLVPSIYTGLDGEGKLYTNLFDLNIPSQTISEYLASNPGESNQEKLRVFGAPAKGLCTVPSGRSYTSEFISECGSLFDNYSQGKIYTIPGKDLKYLLGLETEGLNWFNPTLNNLSKEEGGSYIISAHKLAGLRILCGQYTGELTGLSGVNSPVILGKSVEEAFTKNSYVTIGMGTRRYRVMQP